MFSWVSAMASNNTRTHRHHNGSGDSVIGKPSGTSSSHGSKTGSSNPATSSELQTQMLRFQKIASSYEELRSWIRNRVDSVDSRSALNDPELRKARVEFFLLTCKAVRKDPKLAKTKYEEIFWKTALYPLVRNISEDFEIIQSAESRMIFQDLLRFGHSSFISLIQEFLLRFSLPFSGVRRLPVLCEISLGEKKANVDYVLWIRSFISRCLCSIADLYRYGCSVDPRCRFQAAKYYELAAQARPTDGRAISSLGLLQKDQGEIFNAVYYFILSACKRVKYDPYRQNIDSVRGVIRGLFEDFDDFDEDDHNAQSDPEILIRRFTVTIMQIAQSVLSEETASAEVTEFAKALDLLAQCLKLPIPAAGEWRDSHFGAPAYLHPDLLTKVCVILFSMQYITEAEGDKKGQQSSLRAFAVTVVAQILVCVEHSVRYWVDYTGFRLIPQPDPNQLCAELREMRDAEIATDVISVGADSAAAVYGDALTFTMTNKSDDAKYVGELDSVEEFWQNISSKFGEVTLKTPPEPTTSFSSSYLEAFDGFVNTQPYLSLVHMLFQYIRFDQETLQFCSANFPNVFWSIVNIINLLHIPSFVEIYVEEEALGLFPLHEEVLFREYLPLDKWVSKLNWTGYYSRPEMSGIEAHILLFHRFSGIAQWLNHAKLSYFDKGQQKWICSLERRQLGTPEEDTDLTRKLVMAQRLGRAWRAEEDIKDEKEFMSRRADLPRYLVIDTSCFVRKLDWVKQLYDSKIFKFVIPTYVLEELDRGKSNKAYRDAIRWLDSTTVTQDLDRVEIQKWKDMHKHDVQLESDWKKLTSSERSVRVMVDCAKFFAEEVKRRTDDTDYGLHIRVITDLDLQSVYCARVMEQMEKLDVPHEMKLMRIHDLMGWLNEGPQYFRRLQEAEGRS